jgi:proton-translocating NADH-quinone oxidoreductase chain L
MSELRHYLWLIPGLPLFASAITAFLGPTLLRKQSHWPCVLSIIASFCLAFAVFLTVFDMMRSFDVGSEPPLMQSDPYGWIRVDSNVPGKPYLDANFRLRADALTSMMLVFVTFIGSFIAIYSIGYMHDDPGYPRFFAEIALFVASMTILVLADNFVLLYGGWEGVGLCSYLLIGFWYQKPSAAAAARKAFLVTRLGDVGLFLGILVLWLAYGSFDFADIFKQIDWRGSEPAANHGLLLAAALLLFCGAAGKSAQFPLHVWLPDAMEGPTPVSALIHAATMVTAGVYLVARCTPLYMAAPEAQLVIACLGCFTALLAALIALTQTDLKRVLAYSTLSQLGYMFLALGCAIGLKGGGSYPLVTFAVTAAMFHLLTHAFFKALLFLSAGSVMHAMGGVIDMRRFSGLRHKLPQTHWTFLCGALALAGVPVLSGFWSKDEILDAVHQASTSRSHSADIYWVLLITAIITAGLTAFYTFRAYFLTFWGPEKFPPEAGSHGTTTDHGHSHGHEVRHQVASHLPDDEPAAHKPAGHGGVHESPPVMTIPLIVLAVFSLGIGWLLGPWGPEALHISHFLAGTPGFPEAGPEHANWAMMTVSSLIALGGIAFAWLVYVKEPRLQETLAKKAGMLYQLSFNKFYIDELYYALIVQPFQGLADFLGQIDLNGLDALVDLIGQVPRLLGGLFRPVQNGLVQFYALAMILGLTVFLLALVRWL